MHLILNNKLCLVLLTSVLSVLAMKLRSTFIQYVCTVQATNQANSFSKNAQIIKSFT